MRGLLFGSVVLLDDHRELTAVVTALNNKYISTGTDRRNVDLSVVQLYLVFHEDDSIG